MAFLVLLESLSPVERAVFLLRETFGYDYAEIASIVGRSEANCRQIAVRARKQLEARRPRFAASPATRAQITAKFIHAAETGVAGLVDLLSDDIVLWSDGGGKVRAARNPVVGAANVARLLLGLTRKYAGLLAATPAEINGQSGLLLTVDGARIGALVLDITDVGHEAGGPISGIRIVVNPDKLAGIAGAPG